MVRRNFPSFSKGPHGYVSGDSVPQERQKTPVARGADPRDRSIASCAFGTSIAELSRPPEAVPAGKVRTVRD